MSTASDILQTPGAPIKSKEKMTKTFGSEGFIPKKLDDIFKQVVTPFTPANPIVNNYYKEEKMSHNPSCKVNLMNRFEKM